MTLRDTFAEALGALLAQRLRACLAGLGIVVGVATVIATLAIAEGARDAALAEIGTMGIDTLHVQFSGNQKSNAGDVERLIRRLPGIRSVALSRTDTIDVRSLAHHAAVPVMATTPQLHDIVPAALVAGRWLTDRDLGGRKRVAVVADDMAQSFFPQRDAVGHDLWIDGDRYLIVGVTTASRVASVFVPSSTRTTDADSSRAPAAQQDLALKTSADDVIAAAAFIRQLLRSAYGDDAPPVVVPRELLDTRLRAERTATVLLVAAGVLALLISGVGIMNIMLANVAERTGEIGVRRAVGARRSTVLVHFLAESIVLCAVGAGAGIPLGLGFAVGIAWWAAWPVAISPAAITLALLLASATGLGFGIYPARMAARITPIEAMRAL